MGEGRNKEVNCEGSKGVKEFITVYKEEFCLFGQKDGNKCSPKLALKMIVFTKKVPSLSLTSLLYHILFLSARLEL